ncbi:MAG: phosphatase PAP2 family protein [Legionella sp.]|nr:MAG: phosphatase PAP2 family protein [Legionella sp.]
MPKIIRQFKLLIHPLTLFSLLALISFSFIYVDLALESELYNMNFRDSSIIFRNLTQLGSGFIIIPFLLATLWFRYVQVKPILEQRAWFISACVIFTGAVCWGLKFFFGRSRPDLWHNSHEYGFYWLQIKSLYWSFPSGHATTVLSATFALCFLFPRYTALLVITGFGIALTRVVLGYHYLSDVIAASYFTLLEMSCFIYCLHKRGHLTHVLPQPESDQNTQATVSTPT